MFHTIIFAEVQTPLALSPHHLYQGVLLADVSKCASAFIRFHSIALRIYSMSSPSPSHRFGRSQQLYKQDLDQQVNELEVTLLHNAVHIQVATTQVNGNRIQHERNGTEQCCLVEVLESSSAILVNWLSIGHFCKDGGDVLCDISGVCSY